MASGKKDRFNKKERCVLTREVGKLALTIADAKEYAAWARMELERYTMRARRDRMRLGGLRVGALDVEDANKRSKVNAEITDIEREIEGVLFKLAEKRSYFRRKAKTITENEERLLTIQKALEQEGRK